MNYLKLHDTRIGCFVFLVALFIINGCGPRSVNQSLAGSWVTGETPIKVREEIATMDFKFTQGEASCTLTINQDLTVSGNIGSAQIVHGEIAVNKNLLPPQITGVGYQIKCTLEGKIFEKDPLPQKQVQFWILSPLPGDDTFEAGLRYTQGGAQFPMGHFIFSKSLSNTG